MWIMREIRQPRDMVGLRGVLLEEGGRVHRRRRRRRRRRGGEAQVY